MAKLPIVVVMWMFLAELCLWTGLSQWGSPPAKAQIQCQSSWSEGNHRYRYLEVRCGSRLLLNWWGTPSLCSRPAYWVEPRGDFPRILTYQPWALGDTPLGEIEAGFHLWTYDGEVYRRSEVPMPFLSLLVRSPLPFQD